MNAFIVDGRPSEVAVDPSSPVSYHSQSTAESLDLIVTGPDSRAHVFTTPVNFQPSSTTLAASYVLGQDWIRLASVNAIREFVCSSSDKRSTPKCDTPSCRALLKNERMSPWHFNVVQTVRLNVVLLTPWTSVNSWETKPYELKNE